MAQNSWTPVAQVCNPSFLEAEVKNIVVWGQLRQNSPKTPSQQKAACDGTHLSSQLQWEA
jgi:hypothetical protein